MSFLAAKNVHIARKDIHMEQMAEMAVSAIAQIDAGKTVPTKTVFPVTLVERGTT